MAKTTIPHTYHTLAPFVDLFKSGTPVLTYHKVGLRPTGVRLKGLYVPPSRFETQMDELAAAGFRTVDLAQSIQPAGGEEGRFVISFDDGCRNVLLNAAEPMRRHGFRAIQFVVADLIGKLNEWDLRDGEAPEPLMTESELREWVAQGHEIGSHSLRHLRLSRLSLRDAREEIFSSKKKLEDLFGAPVKHFCYPYGDWNEAVRDLVGEAGYQTGTTLDFGVNTPQTNPQSLFRIMVRHPTRSLKALKARFLASL
jgi:peptidoglycan/xylan/chitin deacetylase (PgdA/CDA1 family)